MLKKIGIFCMVFLMIFSLVACSSEDKGEQNDQQVDDKVVNAYKYVKDGDSRELPRPPKPDKKYKIGVLVPMLANPHFVAQSYGYYDEAEKLGAEVVLFDCGGYAYLDKQVQQMEDLMAMPVDAIVLVAADPDGTIPVVNKAVELGIPVINVNVMTNNEKVVTRIRSDDEEIGRLEAKYHAEKLNGKGNILMINGIPGTSWAIGRSKGYKDYVKENCPEINILDERWCDNDPAASLKEMDDALQVYDSIDAVYTPGEIFAKGVIQALESAGKTGEIIVTAVDPSPDGIAAMEEARIDAMVVQSSVGLGRWGIRAAVMVLEGKADEMVSRYWTPLNVVTKDDIDTFDFVDKSMPPEGWKLPR